jgi:hypothetical protein
MFLTFACDPMLQISIQESRAMAMYVRSMMLSICKTKRLRCNEMHDKQRMSRGDTNESNYYERKPSTKQ